MNYVTTKCTRFLSVLGFFVLMFALSTSSLGAQHVPTPAEAFGFEPGANYKLIDTDQLESYYRAVAEASDRVLLQEIGQTHRGRNLLLLIISSKENLQDLDKYKSISARLAKAKNLSNEEARKLSKEGRAVIWIDSGLHSNELAHSQHNPDFVYKMATDESPEVQKMREEIILLNMPLMNPDGHEIVTDWYRQQKDTEFARTDPPVVYHEYIGHDNNRDWYMNLQNESKAVSKVLYEEWFPQIVVNHHQMGEMGPRMFIPPFADPVNPNIPAMAVRGTNLVGEHMANRFVAEDKPGIIQGITFNMWWNGGMRTVPYFHNMVGILTESTHRSPVPKEWAPKDIPETLVRGSNEIPMKEPSIFYPDPWMGGTASMKQMVDYHLTASMAVMDIGVKRKQEWLYNIYLMGQDAIQKGKEDSLKAYVISPDQWDPNEAINLLEVLHTGGIEIHRANKAFNANGKTFPKGSYVVYTAQAFRPYLMDLMEPQFYPDRRLYPGGPPETPYDMAGWTLPIQMGVTVDRLHQDANIQSTPVSEITPFAAEHNLSESSGYVISARSNRAFSEVLNLLQNGAEIYRFEKAITVDGEKLEPGAFYVAGNTNVHTRLQKAGDTFGLPVYGVNRMPDVQNYQLESPNIGMYQSWTAPMDEGWTRWIFDHYGIDYTILRDEDIRTGELENFDLIILPSMPANRILNGNAPGTMPKQYVGGLGVEGAYHLKKYVESGGSVLGWEGAADFLITQFGLPVNNALGKLDQSEFFIPGSLVSLSSNPNNSQSFGVKENHAGFFLRSSMAFSIVEPAEVEDRKAEAPKVEILSHYGDSDLLLSGWALGEEKHLASKAAALRVQLGKGEVILVGFRPQLRAQSRATFKFLLNPMVNAAATELPEISSWQE